MDRGLIMAKHLQSLTFAALVLLLAWLPASSWAAGVAAGSAFDSFMWTATGGNSQTVGFGSNGTPIATPAPPMIDTDGGLPRVTQSGTLKNPSGNPFTVSAAGRISAANTAKAVGKVIAQNTWPLAVGWALYDLFKEMGYDAVRNPDGSVAVTKPAPSGNYAWDPVTNSPAGTLNLPTCTNPLTFGYCRSNATTLFARVGSADVARLEGLGWTYLSNGGWFHDFNKTFSGSQTLAPSVPSSQREFIDAVAAKSGWPSTSAISRVLAEPAAGIGEKIKTEPLSVTGPATSQGKQTVTQNVTNNTTKTETVTHNHTYEGAKVNTTTVTTTTVVNNTTGETVDQSTKTEAPTPAEPQITCGLPDTPICAVKVNEDDTPEVLPKTEYEPLADKVKQSQEEGLERMKTPGDTSALFAGWNVFFSAPPFASCSPIVLPAFKGASMGSLDPCPVVDGMRQVMGYIWAVAGLFLCLGMVRQSVQGG